MIVVFVLDPTFRSTDVGTCVAQALSTVTVPPYLSGMESMHAPFTVP